jgi:hypothetical protein
MATMRSVRMTVSARSGKKKETRIPSPKARTQLPINFTDDTIFIRCPLLLSMPLAANARWYHIYAKGRKNMNKAKEFAYTEFTF